MDATDLAGLRLHSQAEVDQLMAESAKRQAQYEREDREKRESARAALRTTPHSKGEAPHGASAPYDALSLKWEALRQRTLAAIAPKARTVEHGPAVAGETSPDSPSGDPSGETTGDPELDRLLAVLEASPDARAPSAAMESIVCATSPDSIEADDIGAGAGETPASAGDAVRRSGASRVGREALDPFPVTRSCEVPEFDDPVLALTVLCRELQAHKNYRAVRTRYCQISLRMNLEGRYAPAFRPRPRGEAPKDDPLHMLVYRDQLVIDYHWCHAMRMSLSPADVGHAHVLDLQADFDFAAAWLLTGAHQTPQFRATEAMCLTPLQQCQTMRLHGKDVQARLDALSGGYRRSGGKSRSELAKAKTAIAQWIERDPRMRKHQISYERLWLARELLGPGAPIQSIAVLHGFMGGEQPLARKTLADKISRLCKNVDATLKAASTP